MDFINKMTGQATGSQGNKPQSQEPQKGSSGSSSFMDKLHGLAGGGPESEKKEDALDKGTFAPFATLIPTLERVSGAAQHDA